MLSHANLWLGAVSVAHYLGLARDDVTLAVLPLSFDYGQNQLLSTWYAGGSVVPLDYLTPRDVIKACARHGVTTLAAVPPLWVQLVEQDWPAEAVTPLRRLTNSGGALTVELVRDLRHLFPHARLFPMYGLTEAFRSTYLDPALVDTHPTSMGKAIPFAEILVVNGDGATRQRRRTGPLRPAGGAGILAGCRAHRATLPPRTCCFRLWRHRPSGRATPCAAMPRACSISSGADDAMIKSAGNRISPQEIEDAAVATGFAEEAVALVWRTSGWAKRSIWWCAGRGDEEALRAALKRELPNFMQPAVIRWVEAMPLNPNGKIDRAKLKEEAA